MVCTGALLAHIGSVEDGRRRVVEIAISAFVELDLLMLATRQVVAVVPDARVAADAWRRRCYLAVHRIHSCGQ